MKTNNLLLLLAFFLVGMPFKGMSQTMKLEGIIIDKNTQNPIPYVSIGIIGMPIGTISDTLGRFYLSVNHSIKEQDSIVFSSIGYVSFKTTWKVFSNNHKKVYLTANHQVLSPVNISAKSFKVKTYGKDRARIILTPKGYKSMPQESDEKGREQVSILKVDKDIILRQLNVLISRRNEKNITFRMNIYDVENGLPHKSILTENIIFHVGPREKTGMSKIEKIDLKPYQIHLKGYKEIALGIEILNRELKPGDTSRTAFYVPSYPSPMRSSYYRLKSQSPWEKVGSSYLMASLEASVLKKGDYVEDIPDDDSQAMRLISKTMGSKIFYGNNIDLGKRINISNAEIYYETYGLGEPLLLLHGNNESIYSFKEQIDVLSKHFKVIAVDSRGQGNSTSNFKGAYTYDLFAKDMKQLLDSLNLKKVNIVGWSDGGNTGLIMALKYPEYVNRLVVMGANAFSGEDAIDADVIKIFEDRSLQYSDQVDKESINQKKLADLVLNEPHLTTMDLKAIHLPVLIIAGEHDVIKEAHTIYIHNSIPNSQLEIIKGADHDAPIKESKTFNKLVIEFLK